MIDQNKKTQGKYLSASDRINNFNEVSIGYDDFLAHEEASRCLNCINHPCSEGCPVNNRIPEFISKIKENKIEEAYEIISSKSPFPAICSRVCSTKTQCESKCTRGIKGEAISINLLERYVCDKHVENIIKTNNKNNVKVAIIGAGPSGLACAKQLAILRYDVTIFESYIKAGGILTYGIPEFRLPMNIVDKEIENVKLLGVEIITNKKISNYKELLNDYNYVYISAGASVSNLMNINGEMYDGVYDANDFLLKTNSDRNSFEKEIKDKKVVVIGGGNVAIDVSRSAIRLHAKSVDILYRRSLQEMPANNDELQQALDEKVNFIQLTIPKEIIGDNNKVVAIKCAKTILGEPDDKGRRMPIEVENSDYIREVDVVVEAVGSYADKGLLEGLSLDNKGNVIVDSNGKSSDFRVYVGGDIVTGPLTVVHAIKAGIIAANSIDKAYKSNK